MRERGGERDGEGPFRCASSAALPTQRRHQPPRSALPAPYCMTAGEHTLIRWLSRNTNAGQMTVQYRIPQVLTLVDERRTRRVRERAFEPKGAPLSPQAHSREHARASRPALTLSVAASAAGAGSAASQPARATPATLNPKQPQPHCSPQPCGKGLRRHSPCTSSTSTRVRKLTGLCARPCRRTISPGVPALARDNQP